MAPKPRAGNKRHLIGIHKPTYVRTGGHNKPTYSDTATDETWAAMRTLSSTEVNQSGQTQAEGTVEFTIHYYAGLNQKDQLRLGSRKFDILGIVNIDEMDIEHVITAIEVIR